MGASESKLAFKEDIFRLAREPDIPPEKSDWWARFYQLPESDTDVFALWSPADLRALISPPAPQQLEGRELESGRGSGAGREQRGGDGVGRDGNGNGGGAPKNVETLVYTVIARLKHLQSRTGAGGEEQDEGQRVAELLNCVRILTRLLPYIYEADHLGAWEEAFFWQPRKPTSIWDKKYNRRGRLFDGLDPAKKLAESENNADTVLGRPLGEEMLDLCVQALFEPGFTLPPRRRGGEGEGKGEGERTYSIWQSGIGCKTSLGMSRENERCAMEVLRLVLVICGRMMFVGPNVVATMDIKPLTYLTTQSSRQVVLSLICSLLNTVLKYNPASWRVPLDLSAVTKDPKQLLVTYSLQLLLVLIIYPVPNDEPNAFRKALSRLHRVEDFQFIQQGLTLVLTQPVSGMASYVPTVSKALPWAPEMLVLFWELLQCNKRFRSFIIDTDRAHDFIVLVLFYAMDAKDDPSRQGIVRMSVFILQTLSVEPSFGRRLNKTFSGQESLPAILRIPNFHGSYADYLITSIHTLLTTTKGRLETIYPALLAVINNIAPYIHDLQRATSSKLLDLYVSLSSPAFLLAGESNHLMLTSLLEAMNAILEHQFDKNRRFVDIILRCHKRFEALRDFTVDGALSEIDRIAQERKDRASGITSPTRRESGDSTRSPHPARVPSLHDVPEHGAFAIGDDEDDDEDTPSHARSSISSSVDDAVPVQSRSMSEKARGKQPVGHGEFSRSASRTASGSSLVSLAAAPTNPVMSVVTGNTGFTPTAEWLESWIPMLPLHTILTVIARDREGKHSAPQTSSSLQQRNSSPTHRPTHQPLDSAPIRLQTFTWSPLALGWYLSMLWGFIYASDGLHNRGSNGLWAGTNVRLFNVASQRQSISLRSPKGAVDAVGDSLARRVAGLGFGGGGGAAQGGGVREV